MSQCSNKLLFQILLSININFTCSYRKVATMGTAYKYLNHCLCCLASPDSLCTFLYLHRKSYWPRGTWRLLHKGIGGWLKYIHTWTHQNIATKNKLLMKKGWLEKFTCFKCKKKKNSTFDISCWQNSFKGYNSILRSSGQRWHVELQSWETPEIRFNNKI